jgi:hypothetical protein
MAGTVKIELNQVEAEDLYDMLSDYFDHYGVNSDRGSLVHLWHLLSQAMPDLNRGTDEH